MKFEIDRHPDRLLILLIITDIIFIILHIFHYYTGILNDGGWNIQRERGFAEVFQYLQAMPPALFQMELRRNNISPADD